MKDRMKEIEKLSVEIYHQNVVPKLYENSLLFRTKEKICQEILQDIDILIPIFEKVELSNMITVLELYKEDQSFDLLDVFPIDPKQFMSALTKRFHEELKSEYVTTLELEIQSVTQAFRYLDGILTPYEKWFSQTKLTRIFSSIIYQDMQSKEAYMLSLTYILSDINTPKDFIRAYCQPYDGE